MIIIINDYHDQWLSWSVKFMITEWWYSDTDHRLIGNPCVPNFNISFPSSTHLSRENRSISVENNLTFISLTRSMSAWTMCFTNVNISLSWIFEINHVSPISTSVFQLNIWKLTSSAGYLKVQLNIWKFQKLTSSAGPRQRPPAPSMQLTT